MPDDRTYGYDDPDELAKAWNGVSVTPAEFDLLTREPYCPAQLKLFADDLDR